MGTIEALLEEWEGIKACTARDLVLKTAVTLSRTEGSLPSEVIEALEHEPTRGVDALRIVRFLRVLRDKDLGR